MQKSDKQLKILVSLHATRFAVGLSGAADFLKQVTASTDSSPESE